MPRHVAARPGAGSNERVISSAPTTRLECGICRELTAEERQSLRGLTILVVDDHRDTVDVLQEYLTLCGAQVIGAGGAKSALAILETHVLDAVLVDLYMPREDGWWLLRELRSSGTASANVPVYAVSGKRHDQLDPTSGFAGHFLKPVDLDRLVAALAALPRRLN